MEFICLDKKVVLKKKFLIKFLYYKKGIIKSIWITLDDAYAWNDITLLIYCDEDYEKTPQIFLPLGGYFGADQWVLFNEIYYDYLFIIFNKKKGSLYSPGILSSWYV